MTAGRRDTDYLKDVRDLLSRLHNGVKYFDGYVSDSTSKINQYLTCLETAFSQWIREHPELDSKKHGLSISDLDWVIHQYKEPEDSRNGSRKINNLMLIEEKRFGAEKSFAQDDTLFHILDGLLKSITNEKQRSKRASHGKILNARGEYVQVRYYGLHLLQFSGSGPEDSETIHWDEKLITKDDLVQLLRFEIHPMTLRKRDTTERRHHLNKNSVTPLFD